MTKFLRFWDRKDVLGVLLELALLGFFVVMVVLAIAAVPFLVARVLYDRIDAWIERRDRS